MAWENNVAPAYSGGHDDKDAETFSALVGTVTVTRQTSRVNTGAGGLDIDLTTNSNVGCVRWGSCQAASTGFKLLAFRAYLGLDAAPSSEAALMYAKGGATAAPVSGGITMVGISTGRALKFYDETGTLHATSTTLIPTTGLQEVTIIYDGHTLSTVWLHVIFGTTLEISLNTGVSWDTFWPATTDPAIYLGEALPAANRGCHIYADDVTSERSQSSGDAPHLVAYPRLLVSEPQNPDAGIVGTSPWTAGHWDEGTNADDYQEIDNSELPTHDSDTTYLQSTVASEIYYVTTTATNPITGISATVRRAQTKYVARKTGSDKLPPLINLRISGTNATTAVSATMTTTYAGNAAIDLARPGGGSWVDTDWDSGVTAWGMVTDATTAGTRVTLHLGPEAIYYTASHSLTTTPTTGTRRRFGQAV